LRVPEAGLVFTTTGAFAGLVVEEPSGQAIVPGGAVIEAAERLLTSKPTPAGSLGIVVQDLTPPIAAATRLSAGVVVAHVDPGGPAADLLVPTDVIERMNDEPVAGAADWDARVARLAAGEYVALRVQRGGRIVDVPLAAAELLPRPATLGLSLRGRPGLGAEVTRVEAGSIAELSGIEAGDILVRAGAVPSPSPAQIVSAFDALPPGGAMLVAVARRGRHLVVALAKP
jgi:S1-C subfamily serine protease